MFAPPEIERLIAWLPDSFALVRQPGGEKIGRCIEATRLAVAVWTRAGVPCRPLACDVVAMTAVTAAAIESGVEPNAASRLPGGWAVGVRCDDPEPVEPGSFLSVQEPGRRRAPFSGHLVVAGDGWFADLTASQLDRPARGLRLPGPIVGPYDPSEGGVRVRLNDGGEVVYVWRPEIAGFRRTPAWRQDVNRRLLDGLAAVARGEPERDPPDSRRGPGSPGLGVSPLRSP